MAGMRRRRAIAPEDEDLSEGEESVPPPPPQAHSDDESEGSYYSDEDYDEDEEYEEYDEEGEGAGVNENEGYVDEPVPIPQTTQVQVAPAQPPPVPVQQEEIVTPKEVLVDNQEQVGEVPEEKEEEKQDPSRVPTSGRFFMHDDRAASGRRGMRPGVKKLWEEEDEGLWTHDKFESLDLEDHPPRNFGRGGRGRGRENVPRRGRGGRGRGFHSGNNFVATPNTTTTPPGSVTSPTQPQAAAFPVQAAVPTSPSLIPAQEQRTFGVTGRGRGKRYSQRAYNTQPVPQQESAATTSPIGFKTFSETQDFVQQVTPPTNGVHKQPQHKRYSSQREAAQQTIPSPTDATNFKKETTQHTRLPPSGEFVPRSQQQSVAYAQYPAPTPVHPAPVQPVSAMQPMPYGVYPSQFQYNAPYSYTGYIDPQGVPFAPVQYMPYYPVPSDEPDNQVPYGRGKSQFAPYTGKVWVPKNSKAIPITNPNDVQPRQSKAIPITDPNTSKNPEGPNISATTS